MKITCQSCQSKYNVADEKVQGKIVKIRCRKCGGTIVVNATAGAAGGGAPSANGARPGDESAPAPSGGGEWHVNLGDNDQRQMSLADLVAAYNSGAVTQDTFIWTDGMDDWRPLAAVEPVVSALHASAASHAHAAPAQAAYEPAPAAYEPPAPAAYEPPAPASYHPPAPASYRPSAAAAYQAPAAAAAYQAPAQAAYQAPAAATYQAPAAAYGSSYAAQASAPAAEAKRAAVKREPRGRDLFSTQVGDDVQTSAATNLAAPAADDGKLTGQRNENSVLFSLAVLTKSAEERAPGSDPAAKDDSGMIDLKALVAKSESARPAARLDGDVFAPPLGFAAPPMTTPLGPLGAHGAESQGKSRLPMLIGAGGGIAVLLALGIFIGVKLAGGGTATAPTASAAASIPIPASATAEATASAAPEASASPSASVAASATKPKPVGGGAWHAPAGGKSPSSGANASPQSTGAPALPASPTAPTKKGGDCGCNGDLMCLMKCSTH
jgi:predicted Zn finger-like uncharacterized protein